jgi:sensor histidine kinase regulating citrate/malate metabolism
LLHNALLKRQGESGLRVRVAISADASVFQVCDTGSAVREDSVNELFRAPVPSENGLGIGLYHAARQAEGFGYTLRLASNVAGNVCFELTRN